MGYPIEDKTLEELLEEAKELLQKSNGRELTYEEAMEDDAEGGYFEDD